MKQGGCLCGSLRYEIDPGDSEVANCHCGMCRRASGAPYVTWILASLEQFSLTKGGPAVLKSSDHGERWFCGNCGTPIVFRSSKRPGKIDVTAGSLDEPNSCPPTADYYTDTKLAWVRGVAEE